MDQINGGYKIPIVICISSAIYHSVFPWIDDMFLHPARYIFLFTYMVRSYETHLHQHILSEITKPSFKKLIPNIYCAAWIYIYDIYIYMLHGRQWVNLPNWPFGGCIHGYPCFIILVFINKLYFVLYINVMDVWRMCIKVLWRINEFILIIFSVNRDTNRMHFAPKFRIREFSYWFEPTRMPFWVSTPNR